VFSIKHFGFNHQTIEDLTRPTIANLTNIHGALVVSKAELQVKGRGNPVPLDIA
jgi:hypothetical protein